MGKIRDYCQKIGVEVVGKITYLGKRGLCTRCYMDEAKTQYWIDDATGSVYVLPLRPFQQ